MPWAWFYSILFYFILLFLFYFRKQGVEVPAYLKTPPFEELQRFCPELQRWRAQATHANCFLSWLLFQGQKEEVGRLQGGCVGVEGGVYLRNTARGWRSRLSPRPLLGSS